MILDRLFRETSPGRDAPAWSFFTRLVVGKGMPQGPMLTRYRIAQTPYGGLYLHHHHRPDADRDCHNHPWQFWTLVLRGGYIEEYRRVYNAPRLQRPFGYSWRNRLHYMRLQSVHKIMYVEPSTWTLLWVSRKKQDWGFWVIDSFDYQDNPVSPYFVPWRQYGVTTADPMDS